MDDIQTTQKLVNDNVKRYIETVKEEVEKVESLKATKQEQSNLLKEMKAKQSDKFDFELAEQIANKERALESLDIALKEQREEYKKVKNASAIHFRRSVSIDMKKLDRDDVAMKEALKEIIDAREAFHEANENYVEIVNSKREAYEAELIELGNDKARLPLIDTIKRASPISFYEDV